MEGSVATISDQREYLFWESPCQYLTIIWHFEMLIQQCNANTPISILGAMRNANVMQMKCNNANKCEKCIILGAIQWYLHRKRL